MVKMMMTLMKSARDTS